MSRPDWERLLRCLPEPTLEPDEGRRMVAAVRALRRRQSIARQWGRRAAAAAAVVAVGAALAVGSVLLDWRGAGTSESGPENAGRRTAGAATEVARAPQPSLLDLEQSTARVYEVSDAELAVVVVVDQDLDLGDRG
ncbi:MAG: hypothetical protein ACRD2Z_17480 [Thermoanaerobaculia bacterium]